MTARVISFMVSCNLIEEIKNLHNLPEAGGGKKGELLLMGMKFLFWPGENVLKLHSDDSCTTLRIYKKTPKRTFICHFFFFFFFFRAAFAAYVIPRQEVKSEPSSPAYTTASATRDWSLIFNLHRSSWQQRILNTLSKARDWTHVLMDTSLVLNLLNHNGNPTFTCFEYQNSAGCKELRRKCESSTIANVFGSVL